VIIRSIQQAVEYLLDVSVIGLRHPGLQVANIDFFNGRAHFESLSQRAAATDDQIIVKHLKIGVGKFSHYT